MTKEQKINIAIAEACGWKHYHLDLWVPPQQTTDPDGFSELQCDSLPDYLNDLNAMHEAEKVLTNEQRRYYARMLVQVHPLQYDPTNPGPLCHDGGAMNLFLIASMTAAQRAEAFLRTIGKWKN